MNTNIITQQRINILPEYLQHHVSDYIEFLINRYSKSESIPTNEISQEFKSIIDERITNYNNNPKNVISWQELESRPIKKYNYDL